ncbi:DNA-binding response regulator [Azoarcus indigens]|uniref:LuxR family transcriptional regulator n=1 Tax=Azoarcus indigens TaxID=29545 RepID=A0A4V3BN89_9RHOO|nr:response regulator transcription factor [Azoarcus indigens]NMG67744.1 DNA-binding response regulator [Azoarcus indigens]TDN53472.1 LuxR family transcriptional regulator [Azoarcus indigens]
MSVHHFITPEGALQPRWQEAFPEALASAGEAASVDSNGIVWLLTTLPEWRAGLARQLAAHPAVPCVVLDPQPEERRALLALDGGARGYCHAQATPAQLREVALVVRHGGLWIGPELMSRVVGAARRALPPAAEAGEERFAMLSPRELEVARAVADGLSNKEAALRLGITERTVKAHLGAVFEKLGVRDRLQLVLLMSGATEPREATA